MRRLLWMGLVALTACAPPTGSDQGPSLDAGDESDSGVAGFDLGVSQTDAGLDDQGIASDATPSDMHTPPPEDMSTPPVAVTCAYAGQPAAVQEVNTWQGNVERVRFEIAALPAVAQIDRVRLRYHGYDVDHPGAEGWIQVNDAAPIALPADLALDNAGADFEIDVTASAQAGVNQIQFIAFDGPEGAYFRISQVEWIVDGHDFECGDPVPPAPIDIVEHPAPAGISAFGALAPTFPRDGVFAILAGLQRPLTSVLLDFGPVLDTPGLRMFTPGMMGVRAPNPAHLEAVDRFIRDFVQATPDATGRYLQLYLLNGPGVRQPANYPRAYPVGPEALDRLVRQDADVRAELTAYIRALSETVDPHRETLEIRLVVSLEDNFTVAAADSLNALVQAAGWRGAIGRNPCGCGFGDTARSGDFHEEHPHSLAEIQRLPGNLRPPDAFSNDGWGWSFPNGGPHINDDAVVAMARAASRTGLWFHLWYDPIQGYPVPAQGPRDLAFTHAPEHLRGLLQRGLRVLPEVPMGDGVVRMMGYREARFDQRNNWVLDCYDYAYTARQDEHRECDGQYNPDRSGLGRATFIFEDVIADTYDVDIEGRHTANRNPAGMVVTVNGAEAVIAQRDERNVVWDRHGRHALAGRVEIVIDSTRNAGSDSVRRVRLTPAR